MAAVAVGADNDRVAVATIATDAGTWGNDGGGGGVADEPDIVYQGSTSQSRKVSTSLIGRQYLGGTTRDATATDRRHFLFKLNCTNYTALNTRTTPGTELKIGSDASNYDSYYVFGSDNYPVTGGWQFVPVSINVAGYRPSLTTGSPSRTAIDYYSWLGDYTATAKAENHVIDAIDLGAGLYLTAGDGASADGTFADFLSYDEGTSGNRYGYLTSRDGIYFVNGELAIGEDNAESAAVTEFTDATGQVLVWGNGMVESGYHKFRINLGNASTAVSITGATFDSIGQKDNDGDRGYTTTEDSRLELEVVNTSGTASFIGCVLKNLGTATLTSAVTLDACDIEVESLTQAGAEIFDSIIRTTSVANVATITDATFGVSADIRDSEFVQAGAGHALQFATAATITLTNVTFTGYGADATSSSAIRLTHSTGHMTINWAGGTAPTVNNTSTGTYSVVNTQAVTITVRDADTFALLEGIRVYVELDTGGTDGRPVAATINSITTSGTTATATFAAVHNLVTGDLLKVRGANEEELNIVASVTVTSTTVVTYTIVSIGGASGTGSMNGTMVVIDEDTNGSGVADNTGWAFQNNQPITGRARKGTTSKYYKQGPISGTIESDGYTQTVFLVSDE